MQQYTLFHCDIARSPGTTGPPAVRRDQHPFQYNCVIVTVVTIIIVVIIEYDYYH